MTLAHHHDYPYRLRLVHGDYAEIALERRGRTVRIDPAGEVGADEIVVLTSSAPHRARATREAVRAGRRPTVVAAEAVRGWLAGEGAIEGAATPAEVDGVRIEGVPYAPPRPARPLSAFFRASIAGARPQLWRMSYPQLEPVALQITLPDGARLVHLDLALHAGADEAWVARLAEAWQGAEWLVVGCAWGEADAVATHVPRFGARRVLVAELINAERREMGLPTELVTPLRDRLHGAGIEAHVFATQTSFRFE
ncbi:MAG: hypothetical protein ACOZNI_04920 [Myxococcota bacterium]